MTLRYVPPERRRFFQRVLWVVLRCHSVLHSHLVQRDQDHSTHLFRLGSRRHLDQSRTSVVNAERSGTETGFGRGHRGVEFVGFELLPVNEYGEIVKMVECEYTRDSEAMMQ